MGQYLGHLQELQFSPIWEAISRIIEGKEDGLKLLLTGAVKEAEDLPEEG
jgi:hypothetical protein